MRRITAVLGAILLATTAHSVSADQNEKIDALIEDLRDDDVRWNAYNAVRELRKRGDAAYDALEEALDSDDWQQRQLAASILRSGQLGNYYGTYQAAPEPLRDGDTMSERLIEVTVEGLRDDGMPQERGTNLYTGFPNATDGFWALVYIGDQAEDALVEGLDSDDEQQRFLCALALGMGGVGGHEEVVVELLAPYLDDDGAFAAPWYASHALFRMGNDALDALRESRRSAQGVRAERLRAVIDRLEDPATADARLVALHSSYVSSQHTRWDDVEPTVLPRAQRAFGWLDDLGK